jgi:hypothetical protein
MIPGGRDREMTKAGPRAAGPASDVVILRRRGFGG